MTDDQLMLSWKPAAYVPLGGGLAKRTGWYNPNVLQDLDFGDIVRLRKPHPCGGYEWKVVRLGADIGLECLTCGHRVLLERRALKNRIKAIVYKAEELSSDDE